MEPQTSFQPVLGWIFESFTQCRLKYNFCFVESGIQCNKLGFIHAIIQVWDKWCNTISTSNKYPPCIAANVFIVPITSSTLNSKFTKFSCLFKVETWSKWKIIEFLFLRLCNLLYVIPSVSDVFSSSLRWYVHLKPYHISKMEHLERILNGLQPATFSATISDFWHGSEYNTAVEISLFFL